MMKFFEKNFFSVRQRRSFRSFWTGTYKSLSSREIRMAACVVTKLTVSRYYSIPDASSNLDKPKMSRRPLRAPRPPSAATAALQRSINIVNNMVSFLINTHKKKKKKSFYVYPPSAGADEKKKLNKKRYSSFYRSTAHSAHLSYSSYNFLCLSHPHLLHLAHSLCEFESSMRLRLFRTLPSK